MLRRATTMVILGTSALLSEGTLGNAQQVAAVAPHSANVKAITLSLDHVPLAVGLHAIAREAGLNPFFDMAILPAGKYISLRVRQVAAAEAFQDALRGTGLVASIQPTGYVTVVRDMGLRPMSGTIVGTVVESKSKHPLAGAMVVIDDATRGVTTGADGTFRIASISAGTHRITTKLIGYAKQIKIVTVIDGEPLTIAFALETRATALDQVVVTGTVAPTALKAIPNAMTVITAKEIEQRGITNISQLLRGDVPGVYVQNWGAAKDVDQVTMTSRGSTVLGGNPNQQTPLKTYVDGVEMADPQYFNQIDPRSIERIEILTGPQASTIYGSSAINGVMQIFTKRGTSLRPKLTLNRQSGFVQNNFSPAFTPQHDYVAQLDGVEGRVGYNVGGSWNYMGPWDPGKQTARTGAFGGGRIQIGTFTGDVNLRLGTTTNHQTGDGQSGVESLGSDGTYAPSSYGYWNDPRTSTLVGQTIGLTLGYAPKSWWSHELVVGTDQSDYGYIQQAVNSRPDDTMPKLIGTVNRRTSLRYATTARIPVTERGQLIVTVGADNWNDLTTSTYVQAPALTGTLNGTVTQLTRQPGHNSGGFVQGQLGFSDAIFLTYGLRAEWNPNYGASQEPNYAPRFGIALTRDLDTPWGAMTAKLRGSYGRSTRPPLVNQKVAVYETNPYRISYFGLYPTQLGNSDLGPEFQQGGEGGLELYFGNRGSLVLTRYNQTVENLIQDIYGVDSVRSVGPSAATGCYPAGPDDYCYASQSEYLNVGNIRNSGWEVQGTANLGALTAKGTYTYMKSRVLGVSEAYRQHYVGYSEFQPGAMSSYIPEHTWAIGLSYGRGATSVALNVNGTAQIYRSIYDDASYLHTIYGALRLSANQARISDVRQYILASGYATGDLNMTHRFSAAVEGVLQVQNLTDYYQNDYSYAYATLGRQTKGGVRIRF